MSPFVPILNKQDRAVAGALLAGLIIGIGVAFVVLYVWANWNVPKMPVVLTFASDGRSFQYTAYKLPNGEWYVNHSFYGIIILNNDGTVQGAKDFKGWKYVGSRLGEKR